MYFARKDIGAARWSNTVLLLLRDYLPLLDPYIYNSDTISNLVKRGISTVQPLAVGHI